MAIDFERIRAKQQEFINNGNVKRDNYQEEFERWLVSYKETLEAAIQTYLEDQASSGLDHSRITISSWEDDRATANRPHQIVISINNTMYTSPGCIFNNGSMFTQFKWYYTKFQQWLEDLKLNVYGDVDNIGNINRNDYQGDYEIVVDSID